MSFSFSRRRGRDSGNPSVILADFLTSTISNISWGALQLTQQLSIHNKAGTDLTATSTYTPADGTICSVSAGGLVTGLANGSTVIHVTNGGLSVDVNVNINQVCTTITGVSDLNVNNLAYGDFAPVAKDSNNQTISGASFTYLSHNTAYISVNAAGHWSAVAAGSTTIDIMCGGITKTINANVTSAGSNQLTVKTPTQNLLTTETKQIEVWYGPPGYQTDVTDLATYTSRDTTVAQMQTDPTYPFPKHTDWVFFDLANDLKSMNSDGDLIAWYNDLIAGNPHLELNYDGNHTRAARCDYGAFYHSSYPSSNFQTTQSITPIQPTLTQAVSGSASPQTVTFSSTTGISVGTKIAVGSDTVTVTAVSGLNVTGVFPSNYTNGTQTIVWQWVTVNSAASFNAAGGSGNGFNGHFIIEPQLTGGTVPANQESFTVDPVNDVDVSNLKWRAPFVKSHASGVVFAATHDGGSGGYSGSRKFSPRTHEVYMQIVYHPGKTTTGGGLAGTEGIFEYNNTPAEYYSGAKILFTQMPNVTSTTTLAQAITASASPQTIYLTDISFFTTPGSNNFNKFSLDGGTTWILPSAVNKAANTVTAIVNANYSLGAPVNLLRVGPLAYVLIQGPKGTSNQFFIDQDDTPYSVGDASVDHVVNLNSPAPPMDTLNNTDVVHTWYAKTESGPDVADGEWGYWVNSTKYIGYTSVKMGPNGFVNFQGPTTFRAPAFDMSLYIPSMKVWTPGKVPLAPISGSATVGTGTATVTLNVDTTDNGGVPLFINVYVWDGVSAYVRNGNGVADITIPVGTDIRTASTYQFTHTGLTSGHTYQVKYSFANGLGESSLISAPITFTPA